MTSADAARTRRRQRLRARRWPGRLALARDLLLCLAVAAGLVWLILAGSRESGYNWQWYRMAAFFGRVRGGVFTPGPLLEGLAVTVQLASGGLALALALGLAAMLAARSPLRAGRALAFGYVELVRNTPLVVQLFVIYFIIAPLLGLGQLISAIFALGLFEGAYLAEIFRAGVQAVPREQWEAGASLGLTPWQVWRHIVGPQAFARILPPLTGELINLVKNSALVSIIAVADIAMRGQVYIADTFLSLETWLVVATVYLTLTLILSALAAWLEARCLKQA